MKLEYTHYLFQKCGVPVRQYLMTSWNINWNNGVMLSPLKKTWHSFIWKIKQNLKQRSSLYDDILKHVNCTCKRSIPFKVRGVPLKK